MITVKYPVILVAVFLWIGFICAISFMEAWLKFRAPGITLPLGLGIGRLVFNALNNVEWIFALVVITSICLSKAPFVSFNYFPLFVIVSLLSIQTMWLLPALDSRAEMHIQGQAVQPSNLHFYYIGMEIVKVVCLFVFGVSLFKTITL